ncbi:MAG: amino acid adenylation domain-containing protein, partial [Gammaproteobacteria bacterium]
DELDGAGPAWNVRLPVRLRGALDVPLLEQALALVIARHESLRTTFAMRAGDILQFVASHLDLPLERVALPGASEAELRECLGRLASHTFNLREGPLLRVFLVALAPDDHALLLLTHHIVSDAWSSGVLFRDLAASYAALVQGRSPALPNLPVQYADFAAWQRDWLAGPELERQAAYWRQHLAGAPPLLDLPLDRPRPRLQSYRGNRLGHALPEALTAQLKALAAAEGVTLFMLLFAAFNLLLARWSGQRDLVVGTPIAGRRRTELEGLVGFFANTLALRTRVDPAASFRELLQQVRATALEAFAHQDLPFEKLVEVLRPPRSLAHSPVFQVLFVLQNTPWEAQAFADLDITPAEIAAGDTARFDLGVSATEFEGRIWLGLEYGTDLFADDTIGRLATGFEALLAALVADPAASLAALPVQSAADRRRQLHEWQPAPTDLKRADVYGLFAAQARRAPSATAVECGGERLTYAALETRTAALATRLLEAGASAAGPVAIALARSVDMLVAVLGVLRAGACYLPLDPGHPPERLAFILQDSGARVLLAAPAAGLPGFSGLVLDPGVATVLDARPAWPVTRADAPAYLIYTSGSTGQPKGVLVPQRAVVNFLGSMAVAPGLESTDRLLAVTTLAFDIAVLELLLPLTVGATTVIATDDDLKDPERLLALLDTAGIKVMQATPALWRNLVAAGWQGRPSLRLLCGGEVLDRELAGELLGRGRELWNLYGPTETTVWSTVGRVLDEAGPVSVGWPIANTRCYVLDEHLEPVPIGARGELWIGGVGVALGYQARPELTAERFRTDPFAGGVMYSTGDRARYRGDGRLEVLGRTDFQLKLRGFRIEPGEIEATLCAQPGVAAAVVVLQEVAGDPRLVAYLVARDTPVADELLLAALRQSLPAWMVPSSLVWLAALPLTANGKLDRKALPPAGESLAGGVAATAAGAAPATSAELALGRLFRELLGVPVGLDDDFFARGGHSLLATRLIARIRGELQVALPLRAIFETPTVRGLAAALPAGTLAVVPASGGERGAGSARGAGAVAPLSLVQQRLWFLDRLQPGDPAYHLAWAFALQGPLDRAALQSALDGLAARHGSLRSHFRERDGVPEQVIAASAGWPLAIVAASALAAPAVLAEAAAAGFDLARGPLARALLVESGPEAHTLLLVLHHVVADGWSFGVL